VAFQKRNECSVQVLAVLAVRHGRELGEAIASMRSVPVGDLPRSCLDATLRRLEAGEVTDGRDLVTLEVLHVGLTERLSCEITGSKVEFRLAGCDEDGDYCDVIEVPVYSARGEEARSVYERLERFLELRQQLLDRANAERLTLRLLR
jgi:hypothetical protein